MTGIRLETDGALVTSQDPRSADAGAAILAEGGNAVDAAVAAALALGVLEPQFSGIGGSAWMTVWLGDEAIVIDGAGRAPLAARPDMFELDRGGESANFYGWPAVVDDANIRGARAAYVPGAVAALCLAHERFGRLPRERVFEPARELADRGFEVNSFLSSLITQDARNLRLDPGCAELFLPDGLPLRPAGLAAADRLRQPALAETLARIAAEGPAGFYQGPVAESIAAVVAAGSGTMGVEDLRTYEATIGRPLGIDHRGMQILMPAACGGPTALEALRLLTAFDGARPDLDPIVRWSNALRIAFADRFEHMSADPGAKFAWEDFISADHAEALVAGATPGEGLAARRAGCTSHLNAVDADGMAVSFTGTVLDAFGARVLDPVSGVLLNNGMMWFDPRPGTVNSIRPGIPGLGAACPAILTRDGELAGAVGATGGRRIISAVAQIVDSITAGMDAQDAVDRPRLHCEGETVDCDGRMDDTAIAALRAAGESVAVIEELALTWNFARANAITVAKDGVRTAGLDRLRPAGAATA
ncbi:MAG TPA: gamma-glutamyltransferase [Solirubrobacterales bacterium]